MTLRLLYRNLCLIVFAGLLAPCAISQSTVDSTRFVIETGSVISKHQTPFWVFSNNYNTLTKKPYNFWLRGKLIGGYTIGNSLQFNYGIDMVDLYGGFNRTYFQQAYTGLKLGSISVKGGLWEQHYGNHIHNLSSGGLVWSGNARPLPSIQLSLEEFIDVPFTKGSVQFKGGISHGWLRDNQVIRNAFLHHKYIYLHFGGDRTLQVEYGLHHFAQWGGKSNSSQFGSIPGDLKTFMKVFFGLGGSGSIENESINAIGNHIGSHNLSVRILGNSFTKYFYWQSIFEDRSGMRLKNFRDGLLGLKITNNAGKYFNSILIEFLNTTDQSGRFSSHIIDSIVHDGTGNDNYFNHQLYGGWTIRNMTVGTPMITSPILMTDETGIRIINNKVTAIHTGIEGKIAKLEYLFVYTFSKNYATNAHPFTSVKNQHSFMMKASFNDLLPWSIKTTVAVAVDAGDLLGNHTGFLISLRKEGVLGK